MTGAFNIASDLVAEIHSRYPHESDIQHIVRFRRAVENTTDPDVWDVFCGEGTGEYIEVAVE